METTGHTRGHCLDINALSFSIAAGVTFRCKHYRDSISRSESDLNCV
jgi:hypothetical protein